MEKSTELGGNFYESWLSGSRWTLMEVLWKQLEVCGTRGSRWKYTGVYRSSWKLPRNIFVEVAIDGRNGSFHLHRQWKLPCTSMEASTNFHGRDSTSTNFQGNFHWSNILPPTSMEASMELNWLPWKNLRNLVTWLNGSRWTFMEVLWKHLEVCDTRGSRWKYTEVYRSSWKLPWNIFVEAAIHGSNGSFRFHRRWKLPCTSMGASTKFHGRKSASTNFHGNFHWSNILPPTSMEASMGVNWLPWKILWKLVENVYETWLNGSRWTLMKVLWKQLEVCDTRGSRWRYTGVYRSSWKLPRNIFVEAAIHGSNGIFHFYWQRKHPCISILASTNFHASKSTSTKFHGSFHGNKSTSNNFHESFHGSKFTSMEVARKSEIMWRAPRVVLPLID